MNPWARLLTEDGYVDVARWGIARQSSVSRWSHSDDANRAVNGQDIRDYAFHTDIEDRPWWLLDLGQVYCPDAIVISNRRTSSVRAKARTVRVEVSSDCARWTTVHRGRTHFGTLESGIPLVVPLSEHVPLRYVRLSLEERQYFHLSRVAVLVREAKARTASVGGTYFHASRRDGLGERLVLIATTAALAEATGNSFSFTWKPMYAAFEEYHAIGRVAELFAPPFIQEHYFENADETTLEDYLRQKDAESHQDPAMDGRKVHVALRTSTLRELELAFGVVLGSDAIRRAFWSITFAEPIAKVIELARTITLPDGAVGIHLRAGDIIFGDSRFDGWYTNKVIPMPVAMHIAKDLRAQGRTIVVFGQDREMCAYICSDGNAICVPDLHAKHGFSVIQAAMFDIALMSRCAELYVGRSGFTRLAALAGGNRRIDPTKIVSTRELVRIAKTALRDNVQERIGSLHAAFSFWYPVYVVGDRLSVSDAIRFMERASALDPENSYYRIVLAVYYFRAQRIDDSSRVLGHLVGEAPGKEPAGAVLPLVRGNYPDGTFPLYRYLDSLKQMAVAGIPGAALICALLAGFHNDRSEWGRMSALCDRNEGLVVSSALQEALASFRQKFDSPATVTSGNMAAGMLQDSSAG